MREESEGTVGEHGEMGVNKRDKVRVNFLGSVACRPNMAFEEC